jgi:hypothetical protein
VTGRGPPRSRRLQGPSAEDKGHRHCRVESQWPRRAGEIAKRLKIGRASVYKAQARTRHSSVC